MQIIDTLFFLVALVFSLGIHECAHAWMALKFGDDTAQKMGRLTLNPIPHIDIFGLLPILMGIPIGWAKPVPVNPYRVQNPSVGLPLIAAAGPISNLIQMVVGCFLWFGITKVLNSASFGIGGILMQILSQYIFLNIILALFNLFPVYPLDGGKIITLLMPEETAAKYENTMMRVGYMPLIILLVVNFASQGMVFRFWFGMWAPIFDPILSIFGVPINLGSSF